MKTVYKYVVPFTGQYDVAIPQGARILTVAMQNNNLCFWAEHEREDFELRTFRIFGTGASIDDNYTYVGTTLDGVFVWHLYELDAKCPVKVAPQGGKE